MAIVECKYKDNDLCKANNKLIKENEKELKWICLKDCCWICTCYTNEDHIKLLLQLYHDMDTCNRKNAKYIEDMMRICGHCSQDCHDFDSIYYDACLIKLIMLKAWNRLSNYEFCRGVYLMKFLNFNISKSMKRKYRRIIKKFIEKEGTEYYWHTLFEQNPFASKNI